MALIGGFIVGRIGNRLVRRIAEREGLYRTLVENVDLGITLVDKNYRVVMTNASQGRMFNKSVGEFIGKFCYQEFEQRQEVCSHCPGTRAMATGGPAETETAGTLDDGGTFQVRIRAFPVFAGPGEVDGFIEVIEDISAHKRAEAALQAGVKRFELLTWTAEELLRTTEPQEMVDTLCHRVMEALDCQTFFNFMFDEAAGRLHLNACAGIPEEEARRIEWLDFGVAVCGCVARDCRRIVAEHIPSTLDERTELVKSYGIKAYACHPLLGPGGKLIGTLSFGTRNRETFTEEDLSLMKAVANQVAVAMTRIAGKRALQESEKRLRQAVQHAPFPIIIHSGSRRGGYRSVRSLASAILSGSRCAVSMSRREPSSARWMTHQSASPGTASRVSCRSASIVSGAYGSSDRAGSCIVTAASPRRQNAGPPALG
jgi:PAS domain S-box-containing protein